MERGNFRLKGLDLASLIVEICDQLVWGFGFRASRMQGGTLNPQPSTFMRQGLKVEEVTLTPQPGLR